MFFTTVLLLLFLPFQLLTTSALHTSSSSSSQNLLSRQIQRPRTPIILPLPDPQTNGLCKTSLSSPDVPERNLWTGITELQSPDQDPATAPPRPIYRYNPPHGNETCELIATFDFVNVGTNTVGNTQAVELLQARWYVVSFVMEEPPQEQEQGVAAPPLRQTEKKMKQKKRRKSRRKEKNERGEKDKREPMTPAAAAAPAVGPAVTQDVRVTKIKVWFAVPGKGDYEDNITKSFIPRRQGSTPPPHGSVSGTLEFELPIGRLFPRNAWIVHFEIAFNASGSQDGIMHSSRGKLGLWATGRETDKSTNLNEGPPYGAGAWIGID